MKLNHTFLKTLVASALLASLASTSQAQVVSYSVTFSGPGESPANASPGTGFGTVDYNSASHTLSLNASFSGLTGTTTASHIHAPTAVPFAGTAGVATTTPSFVGFPLGVTSGSFSSVLDLTQASSYNPSYVTANGGTPASAEVALTSAFASGQAYWNIHSSTFGGGEIRGFLLPVPEPSSFALLGLGAGALAWARRRNAA